MGMLKKIGIGRDMSWTTRRTMRPTASLSRTA